MKLVWGLLLALAVSAAGGATAQELSALARLDVEQSGAEDRWRRTTVSLHLSQTVPYRVFTLDNPRRLVIDFKEVDFRGAEAQDYMDSDRIKGARFGALRPGWSRMVLDLAGPVRVVAAGMTVDTVDGTALVEVVLRDSDAEEFAAKAGAPLDPEWAFVLTPSEGQSALPQDGPAIIVIDPGHGGIDPGAEHGGVQEAEVMLALALELAASLGRVEGVKPVVTRSDDSFVPLQDRLTIARSAGASLLISLHADALEGEQATGASVYTLSEDAQDAASQRIAERHNSADVLAGLDLSGQGDEVATVLQDLVRVETSAASDRFADQLVQSMLDTGAVLNSRPRRQAELVVLRAADFPSVLLEVGFLSNPSDRARLTAPQGRAPIVEAVTLAVARWLIEEEALAPLIRQ